MTEQLIWDHSEPSRKRAKGKWRKVCGAVRFCRSLSARRGWNTRRGITQRFDFATEVSRR